MSKRSRTTLNTLFRVTWNHNIASVARWVVRPFRRLSPNFGRNFRSEEDRLCSPVVERRLRRKTSSGPAVRLRSNFRLMKKKKIKKFPLIIKRLPVVSLRHAILDGYFKWTLRPGVRKRTSRTQNVSSIATAYAVCVCGGARPSSFFVRWSKVSGLGFFGSEYDESKYLSITYK